MPAGTAPAGLGLRLASNPMGVLTGVLLPDPAALLRPLCPLALDAALEPPEGPAPSLPAHFLITPDAVFLAAALATVRTPILLADHAASAA